MPRFFLTSAGKGKRIVLWTVASFVLSQLVISIYLDKRRLETRDPLYGCRLNNLRARLAEAPNAPLFLILGSSRVKYSIRPNAMKIHIYGTSQPIVYNFGLNGMGAIRELMYFQRLMADGIRPKWLLLEVWPPLWAECGYFSESRMVQGEDDLHWFDTPLLWRYFRRDRDVLRLALRRNLLPISQHRTSLLASSIRGLLSIEERDELCRTAINCLPADSGGWFPLPWETTTPEAKHRALLDGEEKVKPLLQPVRIAPNSDSALRELLSQCRRDGIKTALILLPEPSRTRDWYTPQARTVVCDYLTGLQRDFSVPIVDTRMWAPDDEFSDSCHMNQKGVPTFSERLGREVVQPLLDETPLSDDLLFSDNTP
jgi:hypothetical protein